MSATPVPERDPKWDHTYCACGKKLPSFLYTMYVCECGRAYRAEVNVEQLVRRVDLLEGRLRVLEQRLGLCSECGESLAFQHARGCSSRVCESGTKGCGGVGEKHVCVVR